MLFLSAVRGGLDPRITRRKRCSRPQDSLASNAPLIRAEDLTIAENGEAPVTVRFGYETRGYTRPEITAALILYARSIGLPIARASRKAVSGGNGEITLKLWIG